LCASRIEDSKSLLRIQHGHYYNNISNDSDSAYFSLNEGSAFGCHDACIVGHDWKCEIAVEPGRIVAGLIVLCRFILEVNLRI
jgi:hypothetical protein